MAAESTIAQRPFRWRTIAVPALLPTLLFSIAEGALLPIIPALAGRLGADLAVAGLVAAMLLVGHLIGDLPAGWLVARVGERSAMIGGSALAGVGLLLAALAPTIMLLGLGVLIVGMAAAVFSLARHALLTTVVPASHRARALSTLGGIFRLGMFTGPFLSAALISLTGDVTPVLWLSAGLTAAVVLSLLVLPDPDGILRGAHRASPASPSSPASSTDARGEASETAGVFRTIVQRRGVLLRLGTGALTISALRAVRQVILPLWALSIGLDAATTALVIGIAGTVDFALFYLGGWIMDRYGRLYTAVIPMVGMGLGLIGLGLSGDADDPDLWFVVPAIWLALANGIGAGILMTMGSDLAGRANPAPFLGAWRLTLDGGSAGAPLLLSAITALAGIAVASSVLGVLGLVGAAWLAHQIPRHLPRETR